MSAPVVALPPLASTSREQLQYSFHSRVMVAATLILCIVVFFVVSLHVYAKWFWRRGRAGAASSAPGDDALWRLHRRHLPAEFVDVRSTPAPPISLGLDPSTINSLPTFIHHPSPRKQPDDASPLLECAVCLSDFQSLEKGRILPDCKHRFHIDCIDVWLRSHSTCPLCRLPVSPWMPHHFEQSDCAHPPNSPSQFAPTSFLLLPITAHRQGERATALSGLQSASSIVGYGCPVERPSTRIAIAVPGYPENLVHGHHFTPFHSQPEARASSKHMADGSCESSSSTKSTSEFQLQGDSGASIARCQSLGVPGRPSEDTESCGLQPVKSRSFHKPIKWLMSRDLSRGKGRIFPSVSGGEGAEEQGHQLAQSSSRSTGLPV